MISPKQLSKKDILTNFSHLAKEKYHKNSNTYTN